MELEEEGGRGEGEEQGRRGGGRLKGGGGKSFPVPSRPTLSFALFQSSSQSPVCVCVFVVCLQFLSDALFTCVDTVETNKVFCLDIQCSHFVFSEEQESRDVFV